MTADDLTRLRGVAEAATPGPWRRYNDGVVGFPVSDETGEGIGKGFRPAAGSDTDYDQRLLDAIHVATFDPPTVAALIDRVERAERERDEAWRQANALNHDLSEVAKTLDALRAAVAGLADEWEALPEPPDEDYDGTLEGNIAYGEWSALRSGARSLRTLLTEGSDDGQ